MKEELNRTTSESVVWREAGRVYKKQPKHLTDNEIHALIAMEDYNFTPKAIRMDNETISMEDLGRGEEVTDIPAFLSNYATVLAALHNAGIRHGDLTRYSIVVKDNRPYLVDFAESRLITDPRPDKRREGDSYWLARTMASMCPWDWHNSRSGAMWEAIKKRVKVHNRTVLDVGCGHGDFLIRALMEGARMVRGVDHDQDIIDGIVDKLGGLRGLHPERVYVEHADLAEYLASSRNFDDVILCLSVLPYVDMKRVLPLIRDSCYTAVIECQCKGDGPGTIYDDSELEGILRGYWSAVDMLGFTEVKEGQHRRSIWRCQVGIGPGR
jgi:tRNA A-37 threonylcarbamoyl transferase component Bud32